MSSADNQNNANSSNSPNNANNTNNPNPEMSRNRRGSVTSAALTNLFQRGNSTATGTAVFPGPITTAAMNDQRRRLSISTLGLSGTSPTSPATFGNRRSSISTSGSDSVDESAIDEDDMARTAPTTPFTRRMSFGAQAMRTLRPGGGTSPGTANDHGFNWSEQLRSRAESSVTAGSRPSFSFASGLSGSPPRAMASAYGGAPAGNGPAHHDRAKSVSDIPAPPAQTPKPRPEPRKPDPFQERILKGDFYMD